MKGRKGHSSKAFGDQKRTDGGRQQSRRGLGLGKAATRTSAGGAAASATSTTTAARGYDSDDENEGFGRWLRSSDGVAYMRLFVVANSLLVFMTVSWSHVWQVVDIVREAIGI
ncbi:uncharacterized protein LOC113209477 [Frankliniella occidentalis]|uniref:Uncharacterized protein LOC113209477 n=1 Tax=Frankliniella occidentalis TaxID=133901 RepID=A0A6J1SNG8_FRAOC|nr:uncharacterized protein LOC113209477 [Frankliniella occidentalis]